MNLLSRSYGVYNINELGLQKGTPQPANEVDHSEQAFRYASNEMRVFDAIGSGASSIVQRAIHLPSHRILALKKINIFEKVFIFISSFSFLSYVSILATGLYASI